MNNAEHAIHAALEKHTLRPAERAKRRVLVTLDSIAPTVHASDMRPRLARKP